MSEDRILDVNDVLGQIVEHRHNGLVGLAVRYTSYLHGCAQVLVMPVRLKQDKGIGKYQEFDVQDLKLTSQTPPSIPELDREPVINMGSMVTDSVTGFSGRVASIAIGLYHLVEYGVEPPLLNEDGEPVRHVYLPGCRLNVAEDAEKPDEAAQDAPKSGEKRPGGPQRMSRGDTAI